MTEENTLTEKTVTIYGYAVACVGVREFANEIDPEGRDFSEREYSESTNHQIIITNEDGEEHYIRLWQDDYEAVMSANAINADGKNVRLVSETENTSDYVLRTSAASKALLEQISDSLPQEIDGLDRWSWSPYSFEGESGEMARIIARRIKNREVLTHQSVRTSDNRYEDAEERPAIEYEVTLRGTESEVSDWTDSIIGTFMAELSRVPIIGKVRVSSCEVTKNGDCYTL